MRGGRARDDVTLDDREDLRGAARALRGVLSPLALRRQAGRAVPRRDLSPGPSERPEGGRDLRLGNRRERRETAGLGVGAASSATPDCDACTPRSRFSLAGDSPGPAPPRHIRPRGRSRRRESSPRTQASIPNRDLTKRSPPRRTRDKRAPGQADSPIAACHFRTTIAPTPHRLALQRDNHTDTQQTACCFISTNKRDGPRDHKLVCDLALPDIPTSKPPSRCQNDDSRSCGKN